MSAGFRDDPARKPGESRKNLVNRGKNLVNRENLVNTVGRTRVGVGTLAAGQYPTFGCVGMQADLPF